MSSGVAACLAVVVGYQGWRMSVTPSEPAANPPSAALAEAWTLARDHMTPPELASDVLRGLPVVSLDDGDDETDASGTPSWLVAALRPDEESAPEGSSMEDEMGSGGTPGKKEG
jgi:hypothetical protein